MKPQNLKKATVAAGVIAIAVVLYICFRPQAVESSHFSSAESACLKSLAERMQPLLAEQNHQQIAATRHATAAYAKDKSQPDFDEAMALGDYKDKLSNVKIWTLYCQEYAKCLPSKPQKTTFESCYSVMSATEDETTDKQ